MFPLALGFVLNMMVALDNDGKEMKLGLMVAKQHTRIMMAGWQRNKTGC